MNCYFHTNQPALAVCPICGKGLCAVCAKESTVCVSCRHAKVMSSITSTLVYLIILTIIGTIGYFWDFMGNDSHSENGLSAYILIAFCTGVYLLFGKFQFKSRYIFTGDVTTIGFLQIIMLVFKAALALAIGIIFTPIIILWQIITLAKNYHRLSRLKQSASSKEFST